MAKVKFAFSTYVLSGGQSMAQGQPVPNGIRFFYGLGQAAEAIKNWGFSTLLLIYYVQVLGLSGSLAGSAIAIALIFDAITDPAVGSLSDNVRSKYGRRHPFMLAAIIPLPFFFFLMFWPPEGLSSFGLFAWMTTFIILTRTALTFFHVPYLALGAELSKDYHERTTIVMIRTGMGYLSALLVVLVAFSFFFVSSEAIPDPQLTRAPYFNFALMSSLTMCVMMFISIWGTRGAIRHLNNEGEGQTAFKWSRIYKDLYEALGNNSFRALIVGVFLIYIYLGVHGALATHLKTFFWHLDTSGIRAWQVSAILGGIAGIPFSAKINRIFDKKMTVILGVAIATLMGTGPVILNLIGLMPRDPAILLPVLCLAAAVASFGGIQALISAGSMIADVTD
jgi:Na+/melibiose symporter-like transporter